MNVANIKQDVRRPPGLEQSEQDLDDADDGRLALLLLKDVGKQLLHRLLSEEQQ